MVRLPDLLRLQRELQSLRQELTAARQAPGSGGTSEARLTRLEQMLQAVLRMQREQVAAASQLLCAALYCSRLHGRVFPGLRGSLRGWSVAVVGSGPMLRQALQLTSCLLVTCNSSYMPSCRGALTFIRHRSPGNQPHL